MDGSLSSWHPQKPTTRRLRAGTILQPISNRRGCWRIACDRPTREAKQKTARNPTSRPLASGLRAARFPDPEILDLATGFYGSGQPARLLPAARPCFGRSLRNAIFRKEPRVLTTG